MMLHNLSTFFSEHSLPLIIDATIKASLVLIFAVVLDRMLARSSAAIRHRVWGLSLWSALLVPILSIVLPQWQIPILPQRAVSQSLATPVEAIVLTPNSESIRESQETDLPVEPPTARTWPQPQFDRNFLPDATPIEQPMLVETTALNANDSATSPTSELGPPQQSWMRFDLGLGLAFIWIVGFLWKLLPILAGLVANHRLIRKSEEVPDGRDRALVGSLASRIGLNRRVPLFEADASVVPMTLGVVRSVIVVPRDWVEWTDEQRECVLLHELAHIKRFDVAYQLIGCIAAAVHWMNPLVWYALRQLRIERELACDDCVLEAGELPSEYAKQLVVVARAYQPYRPSVSVAMASSARLDDRVRAILDTARTRMPLSSRSAIALTLAASILVASIIIIRPVERQAEADDQTKTELTTNASSDEASIPVDLALDSEKEIIVKGIVLKPDGTPAVGATVRTTTHLDWPFRNIVAHDFEPPIVESKSNERGEFQIKVDQHPYGKLPPSVDEYWKKHWKKRTEIAVVADGFGAAWTDLEAIDATKPTVMQLVEDIPIRGRVLDLEGHPVSGTRIKILSIRLPKTDSLSNWFESIESGENHETLYRHLPNRAVPRLLGILGELISGKDGTFELRGVGRERVASIAFQSEKVAYHEVEVATRNMSVIHTGANSPTAFKTTIFGSEFTYTASPTRPIRGVVIDAKTKEPLSGVRVENFTMHHFAYRGQAVLASDTDILGRFELIGFPKSKGSIIVKPNDIQPFLMRKFPVPNPDGMEPVEMTLELHRGVWITGSVRDEVTKEPIVGARLNYLPWRSNTFAQAVPEFGDEDDVDGDQSRYLSDQDGNYRLVGLPGPAIVGALGIFRPYRHGKGYDRISPNAPKVGGSESLLTYFNPIPPSPKWPDAMLEIDPAIDVDSIELNFELDPGASIDIELVDEANQPVEGATIISVKDNTTVSTKTTCKAICFAPDEVRPIVVHHVERKIGYVSHVGPEQIKRGSLQLTLLPCAIVTGRLMKDGEPLSGEIVDATVLPDGDFSTQLPRIPTDRDGRFTVEVPTGCDYSFTARGHQVNHFATIARKVIVSPGETRDLGAYSLGKDGKFVAATTDEKSNSAMKSQIKDKRVSVNGIVLKPDGTPAVGATVRSAAFVWPYSAYRSMLDPAYETPLSKTQTNDRGEFEIEINTQPYGIINQFTNALWKELTKIAVSADGYGPDWIDFKDIDLDKPVTLRLVEDFPIRGRVIDLEGRPVPNTRIRIALTSGAKTNDVSKWIESLQMGEELSPYLHLGSAIEQPRMVGLERELRSGNDGTFEIRGIGRERIAELIFDGENVGHEKVFIATRNIASFEANVSVRSKAKQRVYGAEFTFTATPSRAIEGLVVDAGTKEPLSDVIVESYTLANYPISGRHELMSTTDGQGRFRLTGFPKGDGNVLMLKPNDEQPYLMREVKIPDSGGLDALKMTIELHRGIWIHGRVMNQLTQEPVVGARMYYLPWQSNPFVRKVPEFQDDGNADGDQARYQTDQNGNYRLVGLPGPAIIGAQSTLTKFRQGKGYELIARDAPRFGKSDELLTYRNPINPSPSWPDAMLEIDPSSDAESIELNFELDPGATLQVELVDEANQPVLNATVPGRPRLGDDQSSPIFKAETFAPGEVRPIMAYSETRKIRWVALAGPEDVKRGKLRMQLREVATVTGQLLDHGEPMTGVEIDRRIIPKYNVGEMMNVVKTDKNGRFVCKLPGGCSYDLYAEGQGIDVYGVIAKNLTVTPGETIDFGTLTLGKDRKFVAEPGLMKEQRDIVLPREE